MQRARLRLGMITAVVVSAVLLAPEAHAEDKVKVGLITSLSGSAAVLGQQMTHGFNLAVKTLGASLAALRLKYSRPTTKESRMSASVRSRLL